MCGPSRAPGARPGWPMAARGLQGQQTPARLGCGAGVARRACQPRAGRGRAAPGFGVESLRTSRCHHAKEVHLPIDLPAAIPQMCSEGIDSASLIVLHKLIRPPIGAGPRYVLLASTLLPHPRRLTTLTGLTHRGRGRRRASHLAGRVGIRRARHGSGPNHGRGFRVLEQPLASLRDYSIASRNGEQHRD